MQAALGLLQGPICLSLNCSCEAEDPASLKRLQLPGATPLQFAGDELVVRAAALAAIPRGFPTYSSAPDQPLLGVPVREEGLWHLSTPDCFEHVTFSLYVNGVAFATRDGAEHSISLSPFSVVRFCRFQSGLCSQLKSFKVAVPDHELCCYFAVQSVSERIAEEDRFEWVLSISHTILLIIDSLLPSYAITCDPVPGVPATSRRLMAGYLIHRDDAGSVSVLFCELQAHLGNRAKFVMYENEHCINPVMDINIVDATDYSDIVGINCSCFIIDGQHFAAQTPSDRKLWLRALSNVKVKIQNEAPPPTEEEIWYYRDSIREHIRAVEDTAGPQLSPQALLERGPWKSLQVEGIGDTEPTSPSCEDIFDTEPLENYMSL